MAPIALEDSSQAGIYHLPSPRFPELQHCAEQHQYRVRALNLTTHATLPSVLKAIGQQLAFPEWYGQNLDALFDCLTDPEVTPDTPTLLLINGLDALASHNPEGYAALLEVLTAVCDTRRQAGVALWVAVDAPTSGLPVFPTR